MARLWKVTAVARTFGVLPSEAAEAIDRDPSQMDLVACELVEIAQAYAAHRSADKKAIEAWGESPAMKIVQEYDAELAAEGLPSVEQLRALGWCEMVEDAK